MVGKSSRTKEEKARIVMEALSNTASIAEICRKYNVTSSAFYTWRDSFIAAGKEGMEVRESNHDGEQAVKPGGGLNCPDKRVNGMCCMAM